MKFGELMKYAQQRGFDALATGHYCIQKFSHNNEPELWEGTDKNKDQSYFLAQLTRDQLGYARFPPWFIQKTRNQKNCPRVRTLCCEQKRQSGHMFSRKGKGSRVFISFHSTKPGGHRGQNGQ